MTGHDKNGTTTIGLIKLFAVKEEASILFDITDNSVGVNAERLQAIQAVLAKRTQIDENTNL